MPFVVQGLVPVYGLLSGAFTTKAQPRAGTAAAQGATGTACIPQHKHVSSFFVSVVISWVENHMLVCPGNLPFT